METATFDPRYPIGTFQYVQPTSSMDAARYRKEHIDAIAALPEHFRAAVKGLNEAQLNTPYREGGWTVRQLVHHVPDSHMNAYVRTKLALTENDPTVKTYDEGAWAELGDSRGTPIEISLMLLEALHTRWTVLLITLNEADFARRFVHPQLGPVTLEKMIALYAWHSRHHTAHITELRKRMAW
jgi:hypothetical protein